MSTAKLFFAVVDDEERSMNLSNRAKRGIALGVAVIAGLAFRWLAMLLFLLAAALIAWGQQPQRTEEFLGRLPFGDFLLRALAQLDEILAASDWPNTRRYK